VIVLRLPAVLAELAGGARQLEVEGRPATVGELLETISRTHPVLARRLRDDTGAQRRYVNIYVDGADIRHGSGLATQLAADAEVQVLPSIAGG
jgi:molybdopterin converting factor small subunit